MSSGGTLFIKSERYCETGGGFGALPLAADFCTQTALQGDGEAQALLSGLRGADVLGPCTSVGPAHEFRTGDIVSGG